MATRFHEKYDICTLTIWSSPGHPDFADRLVDMLVLAMIVSFLTAPVFAWLNYKIMFGDHAPDAYKPKKWLRILSVSGIVFLTGFGLVFLFWYFVMQ